MSSTNYVYIRDQKAFPLACVCVMYSYDGEVPTSIGVSVFCPKDKFDKAMGRRVALGRATANFLKPTRWAFESNYIFADSNSSVADLYMEILSEPILRNQLPKRVERAMFDYFEG